MRVWMYKLLSLGIIALVLGVFMWIMINVESKSRAEELQDRADGTLVTTADVVKTLEVNQGLLYGSDRAGQMRRTVICMDGFQYVILQVNYNSQRASGFMSPRIASADGSVMSCDMEK